MTQKKSGGGSLGEGRHSPCVVQRGKHSQHQQFSAAGPGYQREALARTRAANVEAIALDRAGWSVLALAGHFARLAFVRGAA